MTENPLISIIVPVFNGAATIGSCIASVASQTYRNIELIIVNDGSTDTTAEEINKATATFSDLDIECINTKRSGVSAARNAGLENAKGALVAFLDADDTYLPDAMAVLHNAMRSYNAQIAIAQYNDCLPDTDIRCYLPEKAVENTLYQKKGFHESPCAKLFEKNIFANGLRFAEGRRYEDMEICPNTYLAAKCIALCGKKVYNYTENPNSFINNWSDDRLDALWATQSITSKWGSKFPGACRHRRFSACFNIFNLACAHRETAVADKCWHEIRLLRKEIITDRRSRLRNRLAAIASFMGQRATSFLIRNLHLHGK